MRMNKNLIIAAVAAAAFGLSACGGEGDPAETTPVAEETVAEETVAEETPAEELPAEEEPAEEEPAGDFPYQDGDTVDPQDFTDRITSAMEGVQQMTITSSVDGTASSVTSVDNSDPANPRTYSVTTMGEQKIEVVVEGESSWTRIDEGEWSEAPVDPSLGGATDLSDTAYSEVELVSAADRQFNVTMDVVGSSMEALVTVDEQFRPSEMQIDAAGVSTVASYDYESPVEIPSVA